MMHRNGRDKGNQPDQDLDHVRSRMTTQPSARPTYSEAVSSSQASYPPLPSVTKKPSQSLRGSTTVQARNKVDAHRTRGKQPEIRPSQRQRRDEGISNERRLSVLNAPTSSGPSRTIGGMDSDASENRNEHLIERFKRGPASSQRDVEPPRVTKPPMVLNRSIRQYVKAFDHPVNLSQWTDYREVPSSEEIFDSGRQNHDQEVEIPANVVVGPFESKDDYLGRQYALLREDAVAPLRSAVSEVQLRPYLMEADSENSAYIYEKVFIIGLTFANAGVAARITFSVKRSGKKINWEQSKRLLTGSIVALTPAKDLFNSLCHVAVIAARPIAGLEQNPPEIDIFFGAPEEIQIDPQQEWLMVESRNGFYEGHRHTLLGLQKLAREKFPLAEHIVELDRDIPPPSYVQAQPRKDLSKIFGEHEQLSNVDILSDWPSKLHSSLDGSQIEALRRIISKQLAIVQGPPGTGKTYVSVTSIRLMLENMAPGDSPIIVAAHTNHALDQLLRHIAQFEPEFIRLGGWTKDMEVIKPRTLYEVKNAVKQNDPIGSARRPAKIQMTKDRDEMGELLRPLTVGQAPLPASLFLKYGVITDDQFESLVIGAQEWVSAGTEAIVSSEIAIWLQDERVESKQRTLPEDFGIEIEEADLEFEQLKELEAESKLVDDENHDTLIGRRIVFSEPFTGRQVMGITDETVREQLKKRNLHQIPHEYRGPVYRLMQDKVKEAIRAEFRVIASSYTRRCLEFKVGGWEKDFNYLKQARVIGMTTTGLSKYRGLLQALEPQVVIIEEAAETLEGPIAVACFETLQHLILVGDHQQLRAHCNEPELTVSPYYLGVSMFERLVRNKVEYSQLKRQRRMIPEIRRALNPIFPDLVDHPSVNDLSPIPGMGGINTFFFLHENQESVDAQMSKMNVEEADIIVSFFYYLVQNGMKPSEITVLTFYNGQRKLILRKMREHAHLRQEMYLKVVTVDSYQGEENSVVLLSLVRSNEKGNIGFLEVENRVCVALSRAQRGFYIFGDGMSLCISSMLWWEVVQVMGSDPRRIGFSLPLTCQQHNKQITVKDSHDFQSLDGGCRQPCREALNCGHACALKCHPFSHDLVDCVKPCTQLLECGHPCTRQCFQTCKSNCECTNDYLSKETSKLSLSPTKEASPAKTSTKSSPRKKTPKPKDSSSRKRDPGQKDNDLLGLTASASTPEAQDQSKPQASVASGHMEELAAVAKEAAIARETRLRKEKTDALFNEESLLGGGILTPKPDNVSLVRTKTDARGGSRGVWKGTFGVPQEGENADSSTKEFSLLD